jgi:enoyl-CoA hydratase/carnithine racemase
MNVPQLSIDRQSPSLWKVTFNNPPINLIDIQTIRELSSLLVEMEHNEDLKVVVFRSADPEYFLAHWDLLSDRDEVARLPKGSTGLHPWVDVLIRLSKAPVISVADIRGRARGAGSEFVLACDMRFASEERGILAQFEVGLGAVPGGNPMARLAGLMGRGKTLEVILSADDFPASLAERYGYINRALPDAEMEDFVDKLASRLASFEKHALKTVKQLIDDVTLPPNSVFADSIRAFGASFQETSTRRRIAEVLQQGLQVRSEVELNLGAAVARLG